MADGNGDVSDAVGLQRLDVPFKQRLPAKLQQHLRAVVGGSPRRRPTPAARMIAAPRFSTDDDKGHSSHLTIS